MKTMTRVLTMLMTLAVLSGSAQAKPTKPQATAAVAQDVVNINHASEIDLMKLPGIGPSKAQAIVSYRSKHRFTRKTQLLRVKGIGQKTMNRLLPLISVDGPAASGPKAKARPR